MTVEKLSPEEFTDVVKRLFLIAVLNVPPSDISAIDPLSTIYDHGPLDPEESMETFKHRVIARTLTYFGVALGGATEKPLSEIFSYLERVLAADGQ